MAHAALVVKTISRSQGKSAIAAAAYRSGESLRDEKTGKLHDYTRKQDIEAVGIEAPAHAGAWVQDRAVLWNTVEASERRKDSQLAREVLLILPRDLDARDRLELVRSYAQDAFVSKGMVADWAIHSPSASDGERNYHAHILLTMRALSEDGERFGQKQREWNSKDQVAEWRTLYEEHSNRHLAAAGSSYRVDLRSNAAKGIDRAPQPKAGRAWNQLKRKVAWEAKRYDNPLRAEAVMSDVQEQYFEAMWGKEWSWEGYDPMQDPERL